MLSKTQEARTKTNLIIKKIIKDLNKFHGNREDRKKLKKYQEDMRRYEEDMKKYEEDMRRYNEENNKEHSLIANNKY
jgi:predicted RNase H-like nuclease (RuvC/YqgF family)